MATIDIALPDELMQALTPPASVDLQLPQPDIPSLTLPMGMQLQGVADFTRGIPTECSMNFSIMLQLAPMMASMECLLKILQFFGTLLSVGTNPFEFVPAFVQGLQALVDCTNMVLPTGMFCFVKDLLTLIAKMIHCVVEALESVLAVLSGLEQQIDLARQAGNTDLLAALQCAQENAGIAAAGTMQSLQPITVLLALAAPFLKIAQVDLNVSIPSDVPANDPQAMQQLLQTLGTVSQVIIEVADTVPC